MEGWRQRRPGSNEKTSDKKKKNRLDTNRPSHGRTWGDRCWIYLTNWLVVAKVPTVLHIWKSLPKNNLTIAKWFVSHHFERLSQFSSAMFVGTGTPFLTLRYTGTIGSPPVKVQTSRRDQN
jgi:hypothetical protein